jgi:PhnB protein
MTVQPRPDGYHTVTPYLIVRDAERVLRFLQDAFDAPVTERMEAPDGTLMHAEVLLGDSKIMMGEAKGEREPMPAMLYVYVPDCDAAFQKALDAGGTVVREPRTEFYGDRSGGVRDPSGNEWWVGTHVEDVPPDEMARRAAARSAS